MCSLRAQSRCDEGMSWTSDCGFDVVLYSHSGCAPFIEHFTSEKLADSGMPFLYRAYPAPLLRCRAVGCFCRGNCGA